MHAAGVWLKEVKNGNSFTFISIMQQPPGIDTIKSNTATQVSAFSTLHCRSPQARCCTLYVLDVDSFVPMKGLYDNRALRRNKFLAPFTYFLLFFLSLTPCIVPYSEAFMHTSFYNTMLKSRPRITFLGHFHTLSKRRPVLNNPTSQTKVHFTSAPSLTFEHVSTLKRLQGKPEIADFLQRLASNMPGIESNVELYQSLYPFELDTFQLESLKSLIEGNNILLTTPTGSGKTLVGELAMYYSIMKDMRVIYTTPLKALSNQKYIEFCKKFGGDRVSLTTGDITINKGAPITVMTTEIFRNQLYSSGRKNFDQYSNYHSIGPDDRKWDRHFMVVFDEFHFMNDDERGTVWEESIIACPNDLRILALSATIGNAQLISDWMTSCNGPTKWINSIHRPVPLKYHYAFKNIMIPFFSDPSVGPGAKHHTSKQVVNPGWKLNPVIKKLEKCSSVKLRRGAKGFKTAIGSSGLCPRYTDVARILVENGQLPAIFFIFSRNQCEQAANYIFNSNMCLLEKSDIMEVNLALQNFMRQNPSLPITKDSIKLLHAGIAVHHAGLLPIWKLFIEELFAANKLKVIFATETLAAGISYVLHDVAFCGCISFIFFH
jgi:superfamily II RNA helicase